MALSTILVPLINGSNQAIWQSKDAPDLQGRVFSARMLITGTLADYVLEPAMQVRGGLSSTFGWLVPPGPGAGMGLLIFFGGLGGLLAGLAGYFVYAIRNAEDILPDHDALPAAETA